jgi:hypothetical protein
MREEMINGLQQASTNMRQAKREVVLKVGRTALRESRHPC